VQSSAKADNQKSEGRTAINPQPYVERADGDVRLEKRQKIFEFHYVYYLGVVRSY